MAVLIQGRFEIEEEVLRCRFSTLFRAVDHQTGAPCVLRQLHGGRDLAPDLRERAGYQFNRESRVLRRLVHRNLPRVLDTVEQDGEFYLLLEPFEGRTLDYVVEHMSGLPSEKLLLRWMEQIAAALEFLHAQSPPIVYRDLRPSAILITPTAVIKLVEFGLASIVEDRMTDSTLFRGIGTLNFSAPEQLAGARSNPRMDLYALGATFYNLATLNPPPSVLQISPDVAPPSARGGNPQLSEAFDQMVKSLMQPDPDLRPPGASVVRQWAQARLGSAAPRPLMKPVAPPIPRPALGEPTDHHFLHQVAPTVPAPTPPVSNETSGAPASPVTTPGPMVLGPPLGAASMPSAEQQLAAAIVEADSSQTAPLPTPPNIATKKGGGLFKLSIFRKDDKTQETLDIAKAPSAEELKKFPLVDLGMLPIDRETAMLLPEALAKRIQGVCIGRPAPDQIAVAVKDPTQVYIYDHISYASGGAYKPVLLRGDAMLIDLALEYVYKQSARLGAPPWIEWLEKKRFHTEELSFGKAQDDAAPRVVTTEDLRGPVIEAVDRIIKEAISLRASDIHLETFEREVVLRYRIDGMLHVMETYPIGEARAYVKRIKLMANMDIAQEHIPQGGRISVKVADTEFDLRVSTVPVPDGESIVMRLLNKGAFNLKLSDLGFGSRDEGVFRKLVSQPHGMVLVSGPTGSGKSTTLYATLAEINKPDVKCLTVEDPIEYKMPGVVQVQVNLAPREEEKRVTFARALREFLRQDPDVILVGEIRDDETAAISVQAALTGHLVLSTIHTNDASGIIVRLADRGIERFLIGSTLIGGIAQRLVRKICEDCKDEDREHNDLERLLTLHGVEGTPKMYRGRGCTRCHHTGYRGRIAIYEVLEITDTIRQLIGRNATDIEIAREAEKGGMTPLFHDGLTKVVNGIVTLEEVKRVCMTL